MSEYIEQRKAKLKAKLSRLNSIINISTTRPVENLSGKIIGMWEVIEYSHKGNKSYNNVHYWICKCINCGIIRKRRRQIIYRTPNCMYCNNMPQGHAGMMYLLCRYQTNCKRKKNKRQINLTPEEFRTLTSSPCHYCGIMPERTSESNKNNKLKDRLTGWGVYRYNGIDRVNNNLGYIIENCVPCCLTCNRAKGNMPYKNFVNYINRLSANFLLHEKRLKLIKKQ